MDIYGLLEASSEAEDLKSSELLVHFLLESVKFSLKSFLLDSSDSEGRKEFQTQLNDYMLEGIFFILCKINLKHKGYVLLNSATFELLRAYIIFIGKTGINFKAEISTLMGILLYNKLLSVDERVGIARELNTKEKIQVKILFDFLNFILSNNKFLELLYYFNDFSEVRAPLVQNILQIAFSVRGLAINIFSRFSKKFRQMKNKMRVSRSISRISFPGPYWGLLRKRMM